ncbi:MAG: hypothetical protein K2X47_11685 [Bdellovibrionales bacterium]|nr:hypothetical protein [Bdellovibrionales bacterium]
MEKLIDSFIGLIEVLVCGGLIVWGGGNALKYAHNQMRAVAVEALKMPSPSLSDFTKKLTRP